MIDVDDELTDLQASGHNAATHIPTYHLLNVFDFRTISDRTINFGYRDFDDLIIIIIFTFTDGSRCDCSK